MYYVDIDEVFTPHVEVLVMPFEEELFDMPVEEHLRYGIHFNKHLWVASAVSRGANVNGSYQKESFFKLAVKTNNHLLVEAFLQGKPDPRTLDENKRNALHWSLAKTNTILVRKLMAYNVDPHQEDEDGKTPIDLARELKKKTILKNLEERDLQYSPGLHGHLLLRYCRIIR